jgi:hypothetical protein
MCLNQAFFLLAYRAKSYCGNFFRNFGSQALLILNAFWRALKQDFNKVLGHFQVLSVVSFLFTSY